MITLPKVGDKVSAYNTRTEKFEPITILRVYDENQYRQEHYPDGIPEWDNPALNDSLVDVVFDSNRFSSAHFVWGLREIDNV